MVSPCPIADQIRSATKFRIRDSIDADLSAIRAIYAFHVECGTASFEEIPPTTEELAARRFAVLKLGLPYLVAELDGQILGYSYASSYRARPAYRYTVENSVYIRSDCDKRGVGTKLLAELIARCENGPWRQMIAVIGNSGNAGSIALHRKLGFEHAGTLRNVGFKHGQWIDTVLMQRQLGAGNQSLPGAT